MKHKKIVISMIMVVIIIIITLILLIFNLLHSNNDNNVNKQSEYYADPEDTSADNIIPIEKDMESISSRSEVYMVKNAILKLYTYSSQIRHNTNNLSLMSNEEIQQMNRDYAKNIYNLLDEEYIKYKGITSENILNKIDSIEDINISSLKMYINNIYQTKQNEGKIKIYFVTGFLIDIDKAKVYDFSTIVNTDIEKNAYSLILGDYISAKLGKISQQSKVDYSLTEIKENENNLFEYTAIEDSQYVTDLYETYKYNMLYNANYVFNSLDKEYKEKRFNTADKFRKFLENKKMYIARNNIQRFKKIIKDKYTQYVCLDSSGNYMYVNEISPMEYTFILDNHTIDTDEFIDKYDKAQTNVKIGMNADKIIDAIKTCDYEYIYNKLNATFKMNNYNTIERFEQYMKQNIYKNIDTEYVEYSDEGQTEIYKVKIKDRDNDTSKEKNMTIIMRLKENRDFEMSFNVE